MYDIRFYTLSEVTYKLGLRVGQIPISLHVVCKHKHTRVFIKLLVNNTS